MALEWKEQYDKFWTCLLKDWWICIAREGADMPNRHAGDSYTTTIKHRCATGQLRLPRRYTLKNAKKKAWQWVSRYTTAELAEKEGGIK